MNASSPGLGPLLHVAARALRKRFEEKSAAHGLSSAQWRMLGHVCKLGQAPQSRLADLLEIEPISASRLLDRMEALGWITRASDPQDRRVRLVLPTPKALQVFDEVKATADEVYDEALAGLDPEARRILMAGLAAIVSNLSHSEGTKEKVPQ